MLDIGWTELLVVGVIALIVIGPRDLPAALHTFGKYVGQLRRMARQFQDGIDDIARQEELRELQRTVKDVADPKAIDKYLSSDIDDKPSDSNRKPEKIGSIAADPEDRTDGQPRDIDGADEAPPEKAAAEADYAEASEPASKPVPPAASS